MRKARTVERDAMLANVCLDYVCTGKRLGLTNERAHIMTYSRTAGKLKYPSINTRVSSLSFASGLRKTPFMRDTGLWESEEKCKRGSR